MSSRDAYEEAQKRGLDLVEISPNANPPVCKIMDYGKFKYEQKKKKAEQKKQTGNVIKEITLSPVTQQHDIDFKVKNACRFLSDGYRVKFTIRFRGRQMAHPEVGIKQMDKIKEELGEAAVQEVMPKMEGRFMFSVFAPAAAKKSAPKPASKASKTGDKAEAEKANKSA